MGWGKRPGLKSLFLQITFPFDRRNVVLHRCGINAEVLCDFADRRGEAVGFRVFIDEIENRLLLFGKHVETYTEHVYGTSIEDF